ncbi:DUF3152 domain-containing protein [Actinoplanes auranticolor]|uniref:Lipoprotein n=1 Tax=Actinoplanes auranticolor TaxID=47988 RepID=A0A919S2V5_9ACTN|nr:DUF3152 domain-containing protein [Actinoplanes auranticolor]GIM63421.1 lipoprotein [Actinoplanes auranticolor]
MSRAGGRTAVLVLMMLLAGCGPVGDPTVAGPAAVPVSPSASPEAAGTPVRKAPRIRYPERGGGRFRTAAAQRPAPPRGTVLRYRVQVEKDITGVSTAGFAAAVQRTLEDPRGWSAGGVRQLRRVGPGDRYDFTIFLVTPRTRDELCQDVPDGYTSCRNGARVVLNVARWAHGVPHYRAPLAVYRQYMVNHEVGHRLGHGHERCPGRGEPAPVMQQQTLGLHGCTANPWPYRDGERYAGRPGSYDDEVPSS